MGSQGALIEKALRETQSITIVLAPYFDPHPYEVGRNSQKYLRVYGSFWEGREAKFALNFNESRQVTY